jgi:hypothetical protein
MSTQTDLQIFQYHLHHDTSLIEPRFFLIPHWVMDLLIDYYEP